jgi:hypothetical protein
VLAALAACTPAAATHTVQGVLVDVQSPSIQRVDTFVVRTDDGRELEFSAASNFNEGAAHAMSPGHMRQHMALADPVTVVYRQENGQLIALSATD